MKKGLALILTLIMVLGIMPAAMAVENDAADPEFINIPVTKVWEDDEGQERPNITVKLYKDEAQQIQLGETIITAADNWKGVFTVDKSEFSGDTAKTYDLTLVETSLENYTPTDVIHPQVNYTPFTIGEWNITRRCDDTIFNLNGSNVFVGKKGNQYIAWTKDNLTDADKEVLTAAAKEVFNMNKNDNLQFMQPGMPSSDSQFELSINDDVITFAEHKDWSFWARGSYELEKVEVKKVA